MKKHLFVLPLMFLSIVCYAQKKWDYIVFYKPYTDGQETNLYTTGPIKFDYHTQYINVKNADISRDLDLAIKHNDYRFIGLSGNAYVLPGMEGYIKDKNGILGWGYLKKYEKYISKYKFKVIYGTSDVIRSDAPPLQTVAVDYAERYNKLLLKYLESRKQQG